MNFTGVPSSSLNNIWIDIEPLLHKALARSGEMDVSNLLKALLRAEMQLWLARDDRIRLVVITQIAIYPCKRVAEIAYLAGENRHLWLKYCSVLEDWARANGCVQLRAIGREGWKKDVLKMEFEQESIVFVKDLNNGQ